MKKGMLNSHAANQKGEYNVKTGEAKRLLEISKDIEDALSMNIKINHDQVIEIVVSDLIAKYKARKNDEWGSKFKAVLMFYLSESEFNQLVEPQDR